jgi:hypothetical protein
MLPFERDLYFFRQRQSGFASNRKFFLPIAQFIPFGQQHGVRICRLHKDVNEVTQNYNSFQWFGFLDNLGRYTFLADTLGSKTALRLLIDQIIHT